MAKNKNLAERREPLPENFRSLEEFQNFWDTHSTADYEDLMEDVDVRVNIRSENLKFQDTGKNRHICRKSESWDMLTAYSKGAHYGSWSVQVV